MFPIVFTFFKLLTESCAMNHCQDGLWIFFGTEIQQYTTAPIYGHYELQKNDVNVRPYFKMNSYGLWWDGTDQWWIGDDIDRGSSYGYAFYAKDVFCPHKLSEWDWTLWDGTAWYEAENDLGITCK